MDFASNGMRKFNRRQEIVNELAIVWQKAEQIERAAVEFLGDEDPICENLGYACIGLMNAHHDIKANLIEANCNQIEPKSLAQILDVLTRIKWTGATYHTEIIQAYQKGVRDVANFHGIHRNTIADGCTRRLDLNRDGFINLVENWLNNKQYELNQILKTHARSIDHSVIDNFFQGKEEAGQSSEVADEAVEYVEKDEQIDPITVTRNRSSGKYFIYLEGDRDGNDKVINPIGKKIPFDADLFEDLEDIELNALLSDGLINNDQLNEFKKHKKLERYRDEVQQ